MLPCLAWELGENGRFIICEGDHDKYFLDCLINKRNLPKFQIKHSAELTKTECTERPTGGTSGFGPAIRNLFSLSSFSKLKGIAIVTDNDNRNSLKNIVRHLQRTVDYTPSHTDKRIGSINGVKTIIILIPDATNLGNLERLCLPILYSKWPDSECCVKAYMECAGAVAWDKQKELDKAIVRAIISAFYEDDPYKGLGHLFQKGILQVDHACLDGLVGILNHFDDIVERGSF